MACQNCLQNTVPIKPWFREENDTELKDMIAILKSLAKVKDVRVVIQNIIDKINDDLGNKKKVVNTMYQDTQNIRKEDR